MLSYLEAMARWATERQSDYRVQITHREGAADVPKRSAVVGFETDRALGSFAVWETGEVEAEVLIVETLDRPLVISTIVETTAELLEALDRVVEAMSEL